MIRSKYLICTGLLLSYVPDSYAQTIGLEEIVVTAQKRSENLQDIPIAISAFSGETLREDGISDLQDIGNRTPGLVFAPFSVGQPEIAIRGIGTKEDGAAASDSTVVSVDDVYIAARTAQVFDIFDLERVEVLRGPQGTLYGKNSIGGSINFVTHKPSAETEIRAAQTFGNYDRNDTAAMLSGKIADDLFGKFSFSRRKHDGFLRNVLVGSPHFGERQGEKNTWAWRGQLRWVARDDLEILLSVDGADDHIGQSNREPVGSAGPLHDCGCASDPVAVNKAFGGDGSPFTTLADVQGFTDREVFGVSLKVDWDLDWATATSISAFRTSEFDWLEDAAGLPTATLFGDLTGVSGNPNTALLADPGIGYTFDVSDGAYEETDQWTQEVRLTSPGGGNFDWVSGLFFSKEKIQRTETFVFTSLGTSSGDPSDQKSYQDNDGTSFAAYGQVTYHLSDQFAVTGGARYSYEKKDYTASVDLRSGLPLVLQPFAPVSNSESWDNVSGRIALDWTPTDDLLVYGSISTGFKSGGFSGSPSTAESATAPFDPEKAVNYETGIKSQWFDRRIQVNVSAFYTDYTDLQVTRFFQPVGSGVGQFITENAGKAEIKGVEIEYTALPFEHLEIGGSYAYLDAKFTEFTGTPSALGDANFDGKRLRQAPKHSVSAYARYTVPLGNELGSVAAKVSYRYQSLSYLDPDNNDIATIPAYDLWDARLAWTSADQRFELAGWIKNITNEKYRTHVFTLRDARVGFGLFGDPRTYGGTLTFHY